MADDESDSTPQRLTSSCLPTTMSMLSLAVEYKERKEVLEVDSDEGLELLSLQLLSLFEVEAENQVPFSPVFSLSPSLSSRSIFPVYLLVVCPVLQSVYQI